MVKRNYNSDINTSVKILKAAVVFICILFTAKVVLVGYYQHDGFSQMAYYQTSVTVPIAIPRGEIFDTNHEVLATSELSYSLQYVDSGVIDSDREDELAIKISEMVDISDPVIYDDEIKDFWLSRGTNFTDTLNKMSIEEYSEYKVADMATQNEMIRSHTPENLVEDLTNEYGIETIYIRNKMNQATQNTPVTIDTGLTLDEVYDVSTHASEIGGFYLADTWKRTYPQGALLSGFLGTIGPIPEEDRDYYETLGYNVNEFVGVSYAEEALEPMLHSSPATLEIYFDETGDIINTELIDPGSRGYDVVLTIDLELQREADAETKEALATNSYEYSTNACSAGVDPNTGFLLFSSGIQEGEKEWQYYDYSTCTFTYASEIGSIVKPAAMTFLLDEEVVTQDEEILDAPMQLQGAPDKASWMNMGYINGTKAIEQSSNVYFYKLFYRLAGQEYQAPNGTLYLDEDDFNFVRKKYSEFGLGVSTGINMSYENLGFRGDSLDPGFYLDLANGQYDTYTMMQSAQYLSTIANDGTRYQIQYVKSVNESGAYNEPGAIVKEVKPNVLNELTMDQDDLEYVQNAMHQVTENGGFALLKPLESKYDTEIATKTGTAENFYYKVDDNGVASNVETVNCSALAYEPMDDPQIAVSVIAPYCAANSSSYFSPTTKEIVYGIFEMFLEREYND